MPSHGRKYTRLREVAIVSLLAHPTIAEAATASGISEKALRLWMVKPDFAEAVRTLRAQVLEAGASRLTGLVSKAITTLEEGLKARKAADRTRAARSILEFRERMDRDQLKDRVEVLERQLAELQASRGGVLTVDGKILHEHFNVSLDAFEAFMDDSTGSRPPPRNVLEHQPAQQEGQP